MKVVNESRFWIRKAGLLVLLVILGVGLMMAQDYDLVINPAPDVTSVSAADWKSPDIKIGANFGDGSVPNVVQRGVPNKLYARFRINGILDSTLASGSIKIKFYYRSAVIGSTPPALTAPGWTPIPDPLWVTYMPSDGPFAVTRTWPTDFPSVTTPYVTWNVPVSGDYFHIAAELVYPVGINDANITDNVAISLYESQSGLLDVVLLHDVSGSMGYYTYGGFPYIDLAISKASMFLASMNENHRFSVVAFCGNYASGYDDIWPAAIPWLRPATNPNKTSALAAIAGLTAQGMTPMGQGLDRAIDILSTAPDPDRKKVIILLSDGYENYGTPRACSAGGVTPCVGGSILTDLQTNHIKVFTIALGASADTACLECLANQTGGQWYASPDAGIGLTEVLLALQQDASADDLYRMDRGRTGGADDTYTTYFEGKDNALYFILSWDDLKADMEIKLKPPKAKLDRKRGVDIFAGKGYHVVKVKNPEKGIWTYSVTGNNDKNYLVAVRSDLVGVNLKMQTFDRGIVGTPIRFKAYLSNAGTPINNAKVMATVQIPVRQSLATILQRTYQDYLRKTNTLPIHPKLLLEKPDMSPQAILIGKIMGDKQEPLVKTETITVTMEPLGNGYYQGVLKENYTTIAGDYTITVTCADERFHRSYVKPIRLQPGIIDPDKSIARMVKVDSISRVQLPTWLLQISAMDSFGNVITEPLLGQKVKAEVSGPRLGKGQMVFGIYQQQMVGAEGSLPQVKAVTLNGRKIRFEDK